MELQLVPHHIHRRNLAERAIRTFKEHLLVGLVGLDTAFPMNLWCRLLQQTGMTLIIIRLSRIHPSSSAYNELHGTFDFDKTSLAPLGIKIIIHRKPTQRA